MTAWSVSEAVAAPAVGPDTLQVVTVTGSTPTAVPGYLGTLRAFERSPGGRWRPALGPWRVELGAGHLVAAARRREGDRATPIGTFGIVPLIYGNAPTPIGLRYRYRHLVCGDWWDEDPGSPRYNLFVHVRCGTTPGFASSSEALWTETTAYPYFAALTFNMNPIVHGARAPGSGIFIHNWVSGPTNGCIALHRAQLLALLRWLAPSAHPTVEIGAAR
jgi:L,D-peptidoglycan transpeptidase YkuD (ErfK/YbiS/YcfS/YnhG family)